MDGAMLHVVTFTLNKSDQIDDALRALRRLSPGEGAHTLLLFCDLGDAQAPCLPEDAPMLRRLQSGVMSMNARKPGCFHLLVRRRAWDDAARLYLGESQPLSPRQIVAQLLAGGKADVHFDAATCAPASLAGRFSSVLFSPITLACTPDTPLRMAQFLSVAPDGCVCARVVYPNTYPQSVLTRLCRLSGFSLSPLDSAREDRLLRRGFTLAEAPAAFTAEALTRSIGAWPKSVPLAQDCVFVRQHPAFLPEFFSAHRIRCLHGHEGHALLPLLQMIALFFGARYGLAPLVFAAVLLPELWALLHPRLLPGALLRLALLPLIACASLDALLCRLLARSGALRLRLPDVLLTAPGCVLFGAALLPVALYGAQALAALLPLCLLWLAAPLILPALHAPTLERIPLDGEQRRQLRTMAESAYFDSEQQDAAPALRLLAACAGCMLGLLEPDEAARRAQEQLDLLGAPLPASSIAALLVSAQYLRERMGDCDAALRDLPAQIECRARTLSMSENRSMLGAFLSAARGQEASSAALKRIKDAYAEHPLDLLFLPMQSAKTAPVYPLSLPLTHPHTFLRCQLPDPGANIPKTDALARFLVLASSALDHPYYALMMRSPVTGPYMPLLHQ